MPPPPRDAQIVQLVTEAGDRHQVVQARHPSRSYGAKFVIVFTAAMAEASDRIRNPTTLRLLLRLPRHLGFADFKPLRAADVAMQMDVDRSAVTRALRELHQLGIIERDGRGPYTTWRISSSYGWLGTADQWHAHRSGRLRPPAPDVPAPPAPTRLRLLDVTPEDSHGGEPRGRPGCAPVARLKTRPRANPRV